MSYKKDSSNYFFLTFDLPMCLRNFICPNGIKSLLILGLFLFAAPFASSAQQNSKEFPVKWVASVEQTSEKEATLVFKATIQKNWHLYAEYFEDGGPLPTKFTFNPDPGFELVGKTTENPEPHAEFDKDFKLNVKLFHDYAEFRQKIKIDNSKAFDIKVDVEYEACTDHCIFSDSSFVMKINAGASNSVVENNPPVIKNDGTPDPLLKKDSSNSKSIDTVKPKASVIDTGAMVLSDSPLDIKLEPGCGDDIGTKPSLSLWGILITGFLGGLLALLTPCVFPMIPMTVSFFTKKSGGKKKGMMNALIYAASIVVIYVTFGLLITITFGSDALNDLASNGYFNMLFFIVFIIFAISFFGVFEITLPSSWINKADSASEKGGLIGIFFMAFTLALVSFSCTGPIIGTLLVQAAQGNNFLGPLLGMGGFAVALALPFALFAMFPGWLASLPKSGSWLNTVKVCLGFLELALAMKFLSNVDLAYHWGFLTRELFLCAWIVIGLMLGFYLLGKIRFSHDSEIKHVGIGRLLFAIITFIFTLYLIPGLWGAPLKMISGFPPPIFYREWNEKKSECPLDLSCFHNYNEGMAYARKHGKPVMIDFTGWSCVNCRKMEEKVWPDAQVYKRLSNDYVVISLYVDDKTVLPETEQFISKSSGHEKKVKTTGNKWSDMQASKYNTNSQPYYVLLDNNGKILANPRGYTPDEKEYLNYLDAGLCRYKIRTGK